MSPRRLRIALVTDGLEERDVDGRPEIRNGGVGVYIYNLVKHLLDLADGHEISLLRFGAGRLDVYRDPRVTAVAIPRHGLDRYTRWLDLPHASLARRHGYDLIHYPNQFGGALLPRRVRRVVTLHDLTPLLYPRYHPWQTVLGYRLLLRPALRRADRVLVDSAATRAEVVDAGLAPADRVTAIALGVGDGFRPGVRSDDFARRYDLPERFVLTVGVFEPRKNHALLVDALAALHARGEPVGLVIAGREGWGWQNPLDDPSRAHLRPWVRVLRNVPDADLPELYGRAAAFAYASLHEGFGLPLLEAMACGTPVVTSRSSSLPEVAGDAALLADPHDAASFADALRTILRDPALAARLVAAGAERARALSWRRTAERTLEVYESVCRGEAGSPES